MSKTKSKNSKGKGRVNFELHSDNESSIDVASVHSSGSYEDNICSQDDFQIPSTEKYEEKVLQSIENATEKSAKTRMQAIESICEILQHRYFPDFIEDRKLTMIDIVEKSLRRGKDAEQELAARLAILLIIQTGGEDEVPKTICQLLSTILHNLACSYSVRATSCTALAMFYFFNSEDINDIVGAMQQFEHIFAGSYLKGDKSSPSINDDAAHLHVEALGGWSLLATLIPPAEFCTNIDRGNILPSINNLIGLLKSPHVEVRMACGEVIAVILERGRILNESFMDTYLPELIELTNVLSKDSQKYRGKKERKVQRATFRDVLRYLEQDISPDIQIRFGKEILSLNTWAINIRYHKICDIIGPGITTHLNENEFIRDILQLGPKTVQSNSVAAHKQSKLERHLINAAAFKARTLSLRKNRDKRSVVLN